MSKSRAFLKAEMVFSGALVLSPRWAITRGRSSEPAGKSQLVTSGETISDSNIEPLRLSYKGQVSMFPTSVNNHIVDRTYLISVDYGVQ